MTCEPVAVHESTESLRADNTRPHQSAEKSSRAQTPTAQRPRSRLAVGAAIVLVLTAVVITVVIGVVRSAGAPVEEIALVDESPVAASLYVHIHGAVAAPGLYRLQSGARVVDVVAAAGGLDDDADQAALNLARPVSDGEQLYVPIEGEQPLETPGVDGAGRVNLNTADAAALDTLPRIGPALAERIIQWREQNGRFTSVDDLLSVSGIGDKMLAGLRDLVTV